MKYVFSARLYPEKSGAYSVTFPEVEGAVAQGENLFEALEMAENALSEILVAYENYQAGRAEEMTNEILDMPTYLTAETTLIKADTDKYRKNPCKEIELWYNPKNKKYFTVMADEEIEVKPTVEKYLREIGGLRNARG